MTSVARPASWGLAIVAGLLCLRLSAVAQEPAPTSPPVQRRDPPSPQAIDNWLSQLDSDVFDNRERATRELVEAGLPAIEPVKKALQNSGSLEVTTRALQILRELGMSVDLDTQDGARTALEDLAREPTSVGRRAESAIAWLNEQRSTQTLDALEKLGAVITRAQYETEIGTREEIGGIQIDDNWQGTERDFRRLRWLHQVDRLVLVGDKIDNRILPHVGSIAGLRELHLYRTKVSGQGLAALGTMDSLREFGVYYSPLGDDAIPHLKRLKGITDLRLYGTKVTPQAKDQLVVALELERIDYRRGAFLGVSCQTLGQQCELATVIAESPADKAGLQPGDILITFAGKPVGDFEGLTTIISEYGVGDVVDVEYLRRVVDDAGNDTGEKSLKTKITLGEWAVDDVQRQVRR